MRRLSRPNSVFSTVGRNHHAWRNNLRTYPLTEEKRQRWLDEGRGTGEGPHYKPWLTYYDFASRGDMHRLLEGRYRRLCHLFSDVERRVFLYLDASRQVVDIREQYPLDLAITRDIARRLGIQHPRDRHSGVDITMTTDFLVEVRWRGKTRLIALSCKLDADLGDFNIAEHAEIERLYWLQRGVAWYLVTDGVHCVPDAVFDNLQLIYPRRFLDAESPPGPLSFQERTEVLIRAIRRCSTPKSLYTLSTELAANYGLENDKWLHQAYHLIYRHELSADLHCRDLSQHDVAEIARMSFAAAAQEAA